MNIYIAALYDTDGKHISNQPFTGAEAACLVTIGQACLRCDERWETFYRLEGYFHDGEYCHAGAEHDSTGG